MKPRKHDRRAKKKEKLVSRRQVSEEESSKSVSRKLDFNVLSTTQGHFRTKEKRREKREQSERHA